MYLQRDKHCQLRQLSCFHFIEAAFEGYFHVTYFQSRNLALQVEQEIQRRTLMQADFKTQTTELTKMKTKEKHLITVSYKNV